MLIIKEHEHPIFDNRKLDISLDIMKNIIPICWTFKIHRILLVFLADSQVLIIPFLVLLLEISLTADPWTGALNSDHFCVVTGGTRCCNIAFMILGTAGHCERSEVRLWTWKTKGHVQKYPPVSGVINRHGQPELPRTWKSEGENHLRADFQFLC